MNARPACTLVMLMICPSRLHERSDCIHTRNVNISPSILDERSDCINTVVMLIYALVDYISARTVYTLVMKI